MNLHPRNNDHVEVKDWVFSDQASGKDFRCRFFEESSSEQAEWRRGYYNQERTWEAGPPKPGDVNEIVRRHTSQKLFAVPESSDVGDDPPT